MTPEHIVNSQFLDSFVNMGGSRTTIALIIAILLVGRRSKTQMAIAKIGGAASCFNINEPIIFGMPLVLNPIYLIPFVLAPVASGTIAYVLTLIGFMPKVTILTAWTMPPVLGAFLSTRLNKRSFSCNIMYSCISSYLHAFCKNGNKSRIKVRS